jgi:hypothetical protein
VNLTTEGMGSSVHLTWSPPTQVSPNDIGSITYCVNVTNSTLDIVDFRCVSETEYTFRLPFRSWWCNRYLFAVTPMIDTTFNGTLLNGTGELSSYHPADIISCESVS